MVGISVSLSDIMAKTVYDNNGDGIINKAVLNHVSHTLSAEVTYEYFVRPESGVTSTNYVVSSNRGFVIIKGGDYKFGAKIRCANASYIAYLAYRINGGDWVAIGNTDSTALIEIKTGTAISLNGGDTVEMGLKGASVSYSVYIEDIMSWISKVNRLE